MFVADPLPLPLTRHFRNKYLDMKSSRKAQRGTRTSSTKFPRFATFHLRPQKGVAKNFPKKISRFLKNIQLSVIKIF